MNVAHRGGRKLGTRLWLCAPAIAAAATVLAASPSSAQPSSGTTQPGPGRSYAPSLPIQRGGDFVPTPAAGVAAPHAQASPSPSPASAAPQTTASAAPCPPPPPQHADSKDHGFFTVKIEKAAHKQYQLTLTFRCYDKAEIQNAKVSFTGVAPTGDGLPVTVVSGDPTTFSFIGNHSTAIVDTTKS